MRKEHVICCIAALTICLNAYSQGVTAPACENEPVGGWTLEQCLKLADQNNPYVRNASIDISSAKARKGEAMWEYFPSVGLNSMGYYAQNPLMKITVNDVLGNSDAAWNIRNSVVDAATEMGVDYEYNSFRRGYSAGLVVTQPVFAGGRIVNGNRLASVGVKAAQLQSLMKMRDTEDEIEGKYWLVVSLQEKMKTLQAGKRLVDTLYKDVLSAREAGLAVEADVRQVEVKKKELAAGEATLKGSLKLAKIDIFNAIGVKFRFQQLDSMVFPDRIDEILPPYEYIASRSDEPSLESRLMDVSLEAKQLEKKMADGEYLPEIGVGVTYGYGNMQGRHNGERFNGIAFATVKIPLTGLGKMAYRSRRYENEVQKVKNEKEYIDSQLELRRQKMLLDYETAYEQVQIAEYSCHTAMDAENRTRADFQAGRATAGELLQAELESRSANEEYLDKCIECRKALTAIKLYW